MFQFTAESYKTFVLVYSLVDDLMTFAQILPLDRKVDEISAVVIW